MTIRRVRCPCGQDRSAAFGGIRAIPTINRCTGRICGIIFRRFRMHEPGWPGLYFELSPDGFSYGCGFYKAVPGFMDTVREMILQKDPLFLSALAAFEGQSLFCLHGERFKRPRFAEQPENLREWLNRRNLTFTAQSAELSSFFPGSCLKRCARAMNSWRPSMPFCWRHPKRHSKKRPLSLFMKAAENNSSFKTVRVGFALRKEAWPPINAREGRKGKSL